jgi:hypothetical protein
MPQPIKHEHIEVGDRVDIQYDDGRGRLARYTNVEVTAVPDEEEREFTVRLNNGDLMVVGSAHLVMACRHE